MWKGKKVRCKAKDDLYGRTGLVLTQTGPNRVLVSFGNVAKEFSIFSLNEVET